MLKAILLASIATVTIAASASAQYYLPRPVSPTELPFGGSTGNGCMGFGKQVVVLINQVADSLNVEGSYSLTTISAARNQVDRAAEAKYYEARQEVRRQQPAMAAAQQRLMPPDWDVPFGNLGAAFRRLSDADYAKCFPRIVKLVGDTTARVEAKAKAEHEARLAAQEQAAEEAKQQAEINRKRAAEQAVIELAKQEALAEEARKLAEITKKRAEEEAVVEAKRQQADAETRKAQAELARIAAQENARNNKRKPTPGLRLRKRLREKKLSQRINSSAPIVPMVSCSTATRCGRDISSPTSTTKKWTALKL